MVPREEVAIKNISGSDSDHDDEGVSWTFRTLYAPVPSWSTFTMSINSKSGRQDATWELATRPTTNTFEVRFRISDIQGGVTVLKDMLEEAEYQDNPGRGLYKPYFKSHIQNRNNIRTGACHQNPKYPDIMIGFVGPTVHSSVLGKSCHFQKIFGQINKRFSRNHKPWWFCKRLRYN